MKIFVNALTLFAFTAFGIFISSVAGPWVGVSVATGLGFIYGAAQGFYEGYKVEQ